MEVLVTGANGMLGTELRRMLAERTVPQAQPFAGWTVTGVDIGDFDVTSAQEVREHVLPLEPDVIVNCAAYTDVDGCESKRDLAFAANAEGARNLATVATECGARFIHISTDFVFDGAEAVAYTEADEPRPIQVYGESKLAGERFVFEACPRAVVLRTAWLYGQYGKNFVDQIVEIARERDELRVVHDQVGSPTWTVTLGGAILAAIEQNLTGLYHATNAGGCSRYELATEALKLVGSPTEVIPISSDEWPRPAKVPGDATLDCSKLNRDSGYGMPPWEVALAQYLGSARTG